MNKITKVKLTEDRQSNIDIINFLGNKKEKTRLVTTQGNCIW